MIEIPVRYLAMAVVAVIVLMTAGLSWQISRTFNEIATSIEEINTLLPILEKRLEERRRVAERAERVIGVIPE